MDRFWSKVEKTDGCWNWIGCKYEKGYGLFSIKNRNRRAHRVAYEMECGPIPEGMQVLHRCDNPGCVRLDHLFLGTCADNMADKMSKGREGYSGSPGEKNPRAKLTEDQVLAIRAASGKPREIATKYGMSRRQVEDIRNRKSWAHL